MTTENCGHCKHWTPSTPPDFGECSFLVLVDTQMSLRVEGWGEPLRTPFRFQCRYFEARPPEPGPFGYDASDPRDHTYTMVFAPPGKVVSRTFTWDWWDGPPVGQLVQWLNEIWNSERSEQ